MFQTIILAGNLGRDPEMRYTPKGEAVTSFPVAVNKQYTSGDGTQVKETIWFRISVWGKLAETCNQYLKKGRQVLVEGRLTADAATGGPRIWNAQDGSARASFEVTAQTVRFLGSRAENEGGMGGGAPVAEEGMAPAGDEGDIPF
jgi:single-strand DNA-binding protein